MPFSTTSNLSRRHCDIRPWLTGTVQVEFSELGIRLVWEMFPHINIHSNVGLMNIYLGCIILNRWWSPDWRPLFRLQLLPRGFGFCRRLFLISWHFNIKKVYLILWLQFQMFWMTYSFKLLVIFPTFSSSLFEMDSRRCCLFSTAAEIEKKDYHINSEFLVDHVIISKKNIYITKNKVGDCSIRLQYQFHQ